MRRGQRRLKPPGESEQSEEDVQEAEAAEKTSEDGESETEAQEPAGEEPEETARFIQEQVNSALGDTYSEETLRAQETRAAQIRKARERKEAQEAASSGREERIDSVRKWVHRRKKKKNTPSEPRTT